jgi:hypothetical protein
MPPHPSRLVLGNSGGIVRLGFVHRRLGRTPPRLRLAAAQVFPQRRGKPPPFPLLLLGLAVACHPGRLRPAIRDRRDLRPSGRPRKTPPQRRRAPAGRACGSGLLVARIRRACGPPSRPYFYASPRCRSSVVEHSLGKGEVLSSILSGSTRISNNHQALRAARSLFPQTTRPHKPRNLRPSGGKSGRRCSGRRRLFRKPARRRMPFCRYRHPADQDHRETILRPKIVASPCIPGTALNVRRQRSNPPFFFQVSKCLIFFSNPPHFWIGTAAFDDFVNEESRPRKSAQGN